MRAATYLRVSRSDQRSSLQDDETRELITRRGWQHVETFTDEGLSGASDTRPGLHAMLQAARQRRFDVLVVYRGDRVYRSLADFVRVLQELEAHGVAYISVTEPFDTATAASPYAKALRALLAVFAELERDILRERTRSGLEAAKRRGRQLGRPRRAVDPDVVRMARERGMSVPEISRELGVSERTLYRVLPKRSPSRDPS